MLGNKSILGVSNEYNSDHIEITGSQLCAEIDDFTIINSNKKNTDKLKSVQRNVSKVPFLETTVEESNYLPSINFNELMGLVVSIAAILGAGKTTSLILSLRDYIKNNPTKRVLILIPRVAVCRDLFNKISDTKFLADRVWYHHISAQTEMNDKQIFILTPDAVNRLKDKFDFDVVIIDEVELFTIHLAAKVGGKFNHIINKNLDIIKKAGALLVFDAYKSNYVDRFTKRVSGIKQIENYQHDKMTYKREIKFVAHKGNIHSIINNKLAGGKKVYFYSDHKDEAYSVGIYFRNLDFKVLFAINDEKKVLLTEKERSSYDQFEGNPSLYSKDYDLIIASPKVQAGINIDNEHFDFICAVIYGEFNISSQHFQALGRVRNTTDNSIYVFISNKRHKKSDFITTEEFKDVREDGSEGENYDVNVFKEIALMRQKELHLSDESRKGQFIDHLELINVPYSNFSHNDMLEITLIKPIKNKSEEDLINYNLSELMLEDLIELVGSKRFKEAFIKAGVVTFFELYGADYSENLFGKKMNKLSKDDVGFQEWLGRYRVGINKFLNESIRDNSRPIRVLKLLLNNLGYKHTRGSGNITIKERE